MTGQFSTPSDVSYVTPKEAVLSHNCFE